MIPKRTPSRRQPFRRILCPIDFSEPAAAALRVAVSLAKDSGGSVTVMFVNDPLLSAAAASEGYDMDRLADSTARELKSWVVKTLTPSARRFVGRSTIAVGRPAIEILSSAKDFEADLLVIGTRGLSGMAKLLLGSTAEDVLRHSPIPVLAVPSPHAATRWGR